MEKIVDIIDAMVMRRIFQ